jgi:hypothetical protein
MRFRFGVVAAAAAALIAAGCGGSAGGNKPASGSTADAPAPGNAVGYVSIDSSLDSPAWTKAKALLDRFPGKDELLANFHSSLKQQGLEWETDVKPALGAEVDLVWLDVRRNGDNVIGLTKPKDAAKFDALLAKSSPPLVSEQVDGWTAFAESQALLDRFDQARSDSGSLADQSLFSSYGSLPADSIARAWVRGSTVQTAFDLRLHDSGAPADTTKNQFGTLDALTAAVEPGSDGIQITSTFAGDLDVGGSTYHADLPSSLPAGAVVYLSFNDIGHRINKLMDSLGAAMPNFDRQRAQIELVLGYSLKDVFGLLDGEGALAVYPNDSGTPSVLFVASVSDESKARNVLDRLATLAAASGTLHVQTVQVGSVEAKQIDLTNGMSAYAAVFDGKLVTTTSRALLEKLQGNGPKLADEAAYKTAVAQAGLPDETNGFVYADTQEALEYAFSYFESHGSTPQQVVKDNLAPLQGLLLYGLKDGGDFTLTGFLGIK